MRIAPVTSPSVVPLLAVLSIALGACGTGAASRAPLAPPLQGLSAVYSEVDMQLQLITVADAPPCREDDCSFDGAFDQRILRIGNRLAEAAYARYPELRERFPRFEFVVADKQEAGAASSAGGTVVIYRGTRRYGPEDAVLAFILAREMGHVIAGHHDDHVTNSILISIAAQLVLPMLNVARGLAAVVSTNAASTTLASSAVASAASMAGSRALRESYRPQHVKEAEQIGLEVLAAAGWNVWAIAAQLGELHDELLPRLNDDGHWTRELAGSAQRIAGRFHGPQPQAATLVAAGAARGGGR